MKRKETQKSCCFILCDVVVSGNFDEFCMNVHEHEVEDDEEEEERRW